MDTETNDSQLHKDTWFSKYKPVNVNDLVGNKKSTSLLFSWLKSFELNKKKRLKEINSKTGKKQRLKKQVGDSDDASLGKKKLVITSCSSILLTGNHGIGKSVALDVIIKELGYSIKVINNNIKTKNTKDVLKHSYNSSDVL